MVNAFGYDQLAPLTFVAQTTCDQCSSTGLTKGEHCEYCLWYEHGEDPFGCIEKSRGLFLIPGFPALLHALA